MGDLTFRLDKRELVKKLNRISAGIKNFSEPFEKTGNDLIKYFGKKVFDSQGRESTGAPWLPLSAATLKMRDNRSGHYRKAPRTTIKILVWTGDLQDGFKKAVSRTRLVISNTVAYFKYHQLSSRKILVINSKVIEIVMKRVNEYGKKLLKKL